jgi:hypothetical protein
MTATRTRRDHHGLAFASLVMDDMGETAAVKWLRQHGSLPLHGESDCPLVPQAAVGRRARA